MGSQIPALCPGRAPNENTVIMDLDPSSDALQIPKTTATRGDKSTTEQDYFPFEPTLGKNPLPNQTSKTNSTTQRSRKVVTRKLGSRKHNSRLNKLGRKKTRCQKKEWTKSFLLRKYSKELRLTTSALEKCQEDMQALRQGQADARAQASECKKVLDTEKEMHIQTGIALSASQEEASTLRQEVVSACTQAGEFEKALDSETRSHAETKSELSTSQKEASTLRQEVVSACTQAGEFEKALDSERQIHNNTKSDLSASQKEVASLRDAEATTRAQAGKFAKALGIERQHHNNTQADLSDAERNVSHAVNDRNMMKRKVKEQQGMLDDAIEKLNKAKETAATARQGQMKAISELNKAMRLNQGSDQSTDTQLVQKLVELRNNVRTWSLTYFITTFENVPRLSKEDITKILNEARAYSVMGEDFFERSLQDPTIRPTIVRSLLWSVLVSKIFRQYLWVVSPFSKSVKETQDFLSYNMKKKYSQHSNEQFHKFNIWRANGSVMFSQASNPDQKRTSRDQMISKWVTLIMRLLKPLVASQDQNDAKDELYQIIDEALSLDEELCQQVADVSVQYLRDSSGLVKLRFDPQTMTTEIGSQDAAAGDAVSAVLAPALVKRGNSAGNDFDKCILLVPMEVICQPAEPKPTSRESPILVQDPTPSPRV